MRPNIAGPTRLRMLDKRNAVKHNSPPAARPLGPSSAVAVSFFGTGGSRGVGGRACFELNRVEPIRPRAQAESRKGSFMSDTAIEYVFFDLGNVLVHFDVAIACRNIASLVEREERQVFEAMYGSGLELAYERGEMDDETLAEGVRRALGVSCATDDLMRSMSDMFAPNESLLPVIAALDAADIPAGILSNTCAAHWQWILSRRWSVTHAWFRDAVLSYEIMRMKPEPEIYEAAAAVAGVPPESIFFTDDRPENVAGARRAGWRAELFVDAPRLMKDLAKAGLPIFV